MRFRDIVWKDIFKPRYGVIVGISSSPESITMAGDSDKWEFRYRHTPAVSRLPVKRPLDMKFNTFYNNLADRDQMAFCGSYHTLRKLYGIGSLLKHNIDNAGYMKHDTNLIIRKCKVE